MTTHATELSRRKTFGIISHPDAGKTTLTEKLLLFGGAIHIAGAVKAKRAQRHATSDWMAVERERGISVTTSVMQFEYGGAVVNLLDTPGHQDFSEDTYRVLTAVDSALLVIDSVKGVESQTKKLMDVCRMRATPIMTFINKLDRDGRDPFELLDDIEQNLKIECAPLTWPIGMGRDFKGVYDLRLNEVRFFAGEVARNEELTRVVVKGLDDPKLDELLGHAADKLRTDMELLQGAGFPFEAERYLAGEQTPVFFGSAVNNFGVQELLDTFLQYAPGPRPREATTRMVQPDEPNFTGVVFKIQANMDPAHRDRMAFLRINSGKFERGMKVLHNRLGKEIQINNAVIFMARERAGAEEAWPGDIIGIPNHGTIKIGDTFSIKEPLKFVGIPNFAPEHFRRVRLREPMKSKQLEKGLIQLAEEGAVQVFRPKFGSDYILGAVGPLQFEIIMTRLKHEYNVEATYEGMNIHTARWLTGGKDLDKFVREESSDIAFDIDGDLVFLAPSAWRLEYMQERYPNLEMESVKEHR